MDLKMGDLAERFRKSRQRSALIQITLDRTQLKNYPEYAHLAGTTFTIRDPNLWYNQTALQGPGHHATG